MKIRPHDEEYVGVGVDAGGVVVESRGVGPVVELTRGFPLEHRILCACSIFLLFGSGVIVFSL